jgi:hypothetical protein
VGIDHDNPVFRSLVGGLDRTNSGADGTFAVVADDGQKGFSYIRVAAFFDLLDPGPPASQGNFIFSLASD